MFIGCSFIVVVSSVSEVVREGTIDATAFRTINLSDLDLAQSGLFLPPCTNSTNINLAKQKRTYQIKVGSIGRFEKCSRVMESCVCVIARNANSNRRFSCETKPQI